MTPVLAFSLLSALVAPALLLAWSAPGKLRASLLPALAVTVAYGVLALRMAVRNVAQPGEWDFGAFVLYAGVAHSGENFYVPSTLLQHSALQHPAHAASEAFGREVLRVGFPYPPPSMFVFLPLAWFANVHVALAAWYGLQFCALGVAAVVLQRALLPAAKPAAALFFCALALLLPAALDTVYTAQTNFVALAFLALAFGARRTAGGAAWAALAAFVKPYALALLLAEFASRRPARLGAYVATVAAAFAAAVIVFGGATVATYFTSNPASRTPVSSFAEDTNQSLLAELLRASGTLPAHVSLAHEPLYVALGALIAGATALLAARLGAQDDDLAFAAALTTGLLVYPAALQSYAVVLVIPLGVLWARRTPHARGAYAGAALWGAVCLLLASGHAFWAVALVWCALGAAGLQAMGRRGPTANAAAKR